jgi:hypothetical protein
MFTEVVVSKAHLSGAVVCVDRNRRVVEFCREL